MIEKPVKMNSNLLENDDAAKSDVFNQDQAQEENPLEVEERAISQSYREPNNMIVNDDSVNLI